MKPAQHALAGAGRLATVAFVGLLLLTGGCRSTRVASVFSPGPPAPVLLAPTSTADQVIAAVNQNTARVHSYVTNNASISVLGLPGLPLLNGNIAYERPQRFRFTASAITGPEVDFGSNDERLWLWARQMQGPDGRSPLYTVRHDQYATSGAQNLLPVEPRWIIESLGLVTIPPGTAQPPLPNNGNLEVRSIEPSPRGALTRVYVIDPHGWVIEQSIVDPQGVLLASSTAENYHYDPVTQVSLPSVVTVRVPAAGLGLRIDVGRALVNTSTGDPNQVFQPPVMQNHPVVDLGAAAPGGLGAAPPAGDISQAGWQPPRQPAQPTAAPVIPPPQPLLPATPIAAPAAVAPSVYQIPAAGVPLPAIRP